METNGLGAELARLLSNTSNVKWPPFYIRCSLDLISMVLMALVKE
jgi:hypothetical protein